MSCQGGMCGSRSVVCSSSASIVPCQHSLSQGQLTPTLGKKNCDVQGSPTWAQGCTQGTQVHSRGLPSGKDACCHQPGQAPDRTQQNHQWYSRCVLCINRVGCTHCVQTGTPAQVPVRQLIVHQCNDRITPDPSRVLARAQALQRPCCSGRDVHTAHKGLPATPAVP